MPSTIYSYNLTGGRVFPVAFEYLARRFVKITLVGATRQELQLNVDYRFISKTEIETTIAWAAGEFQTIEVRRVTSATDRLVNFTDGSILRSQDLNIAQIQAIHIAEEGRDVAENSLQSVGLSWDALGLPIKNAGYPTNPTDATNVQYVTDQIGRTVRGSGAERLNELPSPSDRSLKLLSFDAQGQPVAVAPASGSAAELAADLLEPLKGTSIVHGEVGLLSSQESVDDIIQRHEKDLQVSGIPEMQGQNVGVARLFLAGYDSLTEGAGGSSWTTSFRKIMRGHLGDGGPGFHTFDNTVAKQEGASFGVSQMSAIAENGPNYEYSISGRGLFSTGATNGFLNWKPKTGWKTARVFYLKKPGGGTFRVGTNDQTATVMIPVDTSGVSISLAYVDVQIGNGDAGRTLGVRSLVGDVVLFGALFTVSPTGFLFGNIAKGGRKLSDVAKQDSALRKQWFAMLNPTHLVFNGGANDGSVRTGPQHYEDIVTILNDVKESCPLISILMVQHNRIQGDTTNQLLKHVPEKIKAAKGYGTAYVDVRRLLGTYAEANANGLMFDPTHPSAKANNALGALYAKSLGFGANALDPGEATYGGGEVSVIGRSGTLSLKAASGAKDEKVDLYKLGVVAGYPSILFKIVVTCNRHSANLSSYGTFLFSLRNGTENNAATGCSDPTTLILGGDPDAGTFTVSVAVVGKKAVVSVKATQYPANFVVEGSYTVPYSVVVGNQVFEN